jgi:hypothetical protein
MLYARKTEMELLSEKFKIKISTWNQDDYKHFIFLQEYIYTTIKAAGD